jgi:protoporphyrinogen oxidase
VETSDSTDRRTHACLRGPGVSRTLILGAGLTGLSTSYHLDHHDTLVIEKDTSPFGHAKSFKTGGFHWDEGPHVSFTRSPYVRQLLESTVDGTIREYPVRVGNYFHGSWVDHPIQTSLHQVPEPLRSECVQSFRASRAGAEAGADPADYAKWLEVALGERMTEAFSAVYTQKYWTVPPSDMTVDWVGGRVHSPTLEDVEMGSRGPLGRSNHYITSVRYPAEGGFQTLAAGLGREAPVSYGVEVVSVDLQSRSIRLDSGESFTWDRLVSTIPLPDFVKRCKGVPSEVVEAAGQLSCTRMLLVNVEVPHAARQPYDWIYVYDPDFHSARLHFTEKLSPKMAPAGHSGIQVEVYFNPHQAAPGDLDRIAEEVVAELRAMALVDPGVRTRHTWRWVERANVLFDHARRPALDRVLGWLAENGLEREPDDLAPTTDWDAPHLASLGPLALAGRFGEWKYFWSDDCILRGRDLAARIQAGV